MPPGLTYFFLYNEDDVLILFFDPTHCAGWVKINFIVTTPLLNIYSFCFTWSVSNHLPTGTFVFQWSLVFTVDRMILKFLFKWNYLGKGRGCYLYSRITKMNWNSPRQIKTYACPNYVLQVWRKMNYLLIIEDTRYS